MLKLVYVYECDCCGKCTPPMKASSILLVWARAAGWKIEEDSKCLCRCDLCRVADRQYPKDSSYPKECGS